MTCICFGCSAPPRFSEFIYCSIATSKNILTYFSYNRIEINNLLKVFVQISKTSFEFCNNLGLLPRSLPHPTSVFDICTNTSSSFISIVITTPGLVLCVHTVDDRVAILKVSINFYCLAQKVSCVNTHLIYFCCFWTLHVQEEERVDRKSPILSKVHY